MIASKRREAEAFGAFLSANGLTQREVAVGVEVNESFISRLARGETGAAQATINAILDFLSSRLGRPVSYEEAFRGRVVGALVVGGSEARA